VKALHEQWLPTAFVLLWSSAYIAGAVATPAIAPLAVTLWRFLIAGSLLALIAWWRHERWPTGRELKGALAAGILLFAIQFAALYIGMALHMPAATTALIACSAPLFVASASAVLGWERLSTRRWAGVAIGLTGVVVTLSDRLGRPPSTGALAWALLGLAGLVAGTMLQGRMKFQSGPSAIAAVELLASALVLALVAPFAGSLAIPTTPSVLAAFAFIALLAGVGAPLLLFALIRRRGATGASSLLFIVPPLTALEGWLVLGTRIGPAAIAGLAISALGLWLGRAITTKAIAANATAANVTPANTVPANATAANATAAISANAIPAHPALLMPLQAAAASTVPATEPLGSDRLRRSRHQTLPVVGGRSTRPPSERSME
jgi:drug/metabolite transporter (DMT)-like permease